MVRGRAEREIERLYREHGHVVLRRARTLMGSDSEARDAFHDVFVSLMADPGRLEGVERKTAWLYQVVTNHCLNLMRKRSGRSRILASIEPTAEVAPRAESLATVRQLLARLNPPLDEVAVYVFVDGMTHEEIARVLGCSRRHVGDLVKRLKDTVGDDEPSKVTLRVTEQAP